MTTVKKDGHSHPIDLEKQVLSRSNPKISPGRGRGQLSKGTFPGSLGKLIYKPHLRPDPRESLATPTTPRPRPQRAWSTPDSSQPPETTPLNRLRPEPAFSPRQPTVCRRRSDLDPAPSQPPAPLAPPQSPPRCRPRPAPPSAGRSARKLLNRESDGL